MRQGFFYLAHLIELKLSKRSFQSLDMDTCCSLSTTCMMHGTRFRGSHKKILDKKNRAFKLSVLNARIPGHHCTTGIYIYPYLAVAASESERNECPCLNSVPPEAIVWQLLPQRMWINNLFEMVVVTFVWGPFCSKGFPVLVVDKLSS